MLIIRPVDFPDLPALEQLSAKSGGGITTLPANREHLARLIGTTQNSLNKKVAHPHDESYHFVLEETTTGHLIGISGIESCIGLDTPFYSYRIDEVIHASSELQIHNRIPSLNLCQDYNGTSRLCTRFLEPEQNTAFNSHLLSRARMLFMAEHMKRFSRRTVAELQGLIDEQGKSPFWEAVGRHFFRMDLAKADYLSGINRKTFIAELMPHYPVYVPLLSEDAQEALGQPRPDIEHVMDLLEDEGFEYRGYVDIFDAGPTLEVRTDNIRTIWQSRNCTVKTGNAEGDDWLMVSNNLLQNYRCLIMRGNAEQPVLEADVADRLQVRDGDTIRLIQLDADDLGM